MHFRINGLDPAPFRHLFGLDDAQLRAHGAVRRVVDAAVGFPCRVELRDAQPGETVLLLNHVHQPADTPYRASHAIYVREGAQTGCEAFDSVPASLRDRLISLRAFDGTHMMRSAEVMQGADLPQGIARLFADPQVTYLQAHYAARGCYAAHVARA